MRLVTFTAADESRIGVWQADGTVLDLTDDPQLPRDMAGFVALGTDGLAAAAALADSGSGTEFGAVTLDAPVRPRNNVMAVGRNYHEHALEFTDSGFDASENEYIHKGVSTRRFKRTWSLARYMEVDKAGFEDGILKLELKRNLPEELKPKKIKIN